MLKEKGDAFLQNVRNKNPAVQYNKQKRPESPKMTWKPHTSNERTTNEQSCSFPILTLPNPHKEQILVNSQVSSHSSTSNIGGSRNIEILGSSSNDERGRTNAFLPTELVRQQICMAVSTESKYLYFQQHELSA
jgi:hypothetical protein